MKKFRIMNVLFTVTDMNRLVDFLITEKLTYKYICVSNVHTTVMSNRSVRFDSIQRGSFLNLMDGKPIQLLAELNGMKCERITGPELMEELIKSTEYSDKTHFFYGSTEDTLETMLKNLKIKYPDFKVAGYYSPPFRKLSQEEKYEHIKIINRLNPTYVWVGLGAPKQEEWMFENHTQIESLLIGVGAGFDYHSGKLKRAPLWMQKYSLEWVYRLFQEPKRLWKRYFIYNTLFIYYLIFSKNRSKEK